MTVRWEAGAPATGWSWVKVSMEAAPSHAASASTPSISMGSEVRVAGTLLGGEAGTPREECG